MMRLILAIGLSAWCSVGSAQVATSDLKPVPADAGTVQLSAENCFVQFVGTHSGEDPNPRVGVFKKLAGTAQVAEGGLRSVEVVIDTASLETPIGKLTNHLKSPDFFDVREHPQAKFVSSKIVEGADGGQSVVGNLTIMGKTKEVTFPAEIEVADSGITMAAELSIDRTKFGMSKMTGKVDRKVSLTIAIGKPSSLAGTGDGNARVEAAKAKANPGQRPRGGFDPAALFKRRDANGDGKLVGDEIAARMQQNLDKFDVDNDGTITQAEFENRMKEVRGEGR